MIARACRSVGSSCVDYCIAIVSPWACNVCMSFDILLLFVVESSVNCGCRTDASLSNEGSILSGKSRAAVRTMVLAELVAMTPVPRCSFSCIFVRYTRILDCSWSYPLPISGGDKECVVQPLVGFSCADNSGVYRDPAEYFLVLNDPFFFFPLW